MIKPDDPRDLAVNLLPRSTCSVQVAAVIVDKEGRIASWGWNSVGDGYGEHAEAAAIRRCNHKRLAGSIIYVASVRRKSGNAVLSKPCEDCTDLCRGLGLEMGWRDGNGEWMASW